jgi:hypothetical protein
MTVTREEMATKVDLTDWFSLRAHLERGGVIVIDNFLDLVEVALKVANDDSKAIEGWITSGQIGKPTAEQIEKWDAEKGKQFLCLIVSPFVLVQEKLPVSG